MTLTIAAGLTVADSETLDRPGDRWAVLTAAVLWPFAILFLLWLLVGCVVPAVEWHDGVALLHMGWLVKEGQIPYSDFMCHHYPLFLLLLRVLSTLPPVQALVFCKLMVGVFTGLAMVLGTWALTRFLRPVPPWFAPLTLALAVAARVTGAGVQFRAEVFEGLFSVAAIVLWMALVRSTRPRAGLAVICGTSAGLALALTPKAAFPLAGVMLYVLVVRPKIGALSLLTTAVVFSAVLLLSLAALHVSWSAFATWGIAYNRRFARTSVLTAEHARFLLFWGTLSALGLLAAIAHPRWRPLCATFLGGVLGIVWTSSAGQLAGATYLWGAASAAAGLSVLVTRLPRFLTLPAGLAAACSALYMLLTLSTLPPPSLTSYHGGLWISDLQVMTQYLACCHLDQRQPPRSPGATAAAPPSAMPMVFCMTPLHPMYARDLSGWLWHMPSLRELGRPEMPSARWFIHHAKPTQWPDHLPLIISMPQRYVEAAIKLGLLRGITLPQYRALLSTEYVRVSMSGGRVVWFLRQPWMQFRLRGASDNPSSHR